MRALAARPLSFFPRAGWLEAMGLQRAWHRAMPPNIHPDHTHTQPSSAHTRAHAHTEHRSHPCATPACGAHQRAPPTPTPPALAAGRSAQLIGALVVYEMNSLVDEMHYEELLAVFDGALLPALAYALFPTVDGGCPSAVAPDRAVLCRSALCCPLRVFQPVWLSDLSRPALHCPAAGHPPAKGLEEEAIAALPAVQLSPQAAAALASAACAVCLDAFQPGETARWVAPPWAPYCPPTA